MYIEIMEEKLAILNHKNKLGKTSLMMCAESCSNEPSTVEVLKLLVENGANVNEKCNNGMDALMYALKGGKFELVMYLWELTEEKNMEKILEYSIVGKEKKAIDFVLSKLESKAELGKVAHIIIEHGNAELIELLKQQNIVPDLSRVNITTRYLNNLESKNDAFDQYVTTIKMTNDADECSVCYEKLTDGQNIMSIGCKHFFHVDCCNSWISINKSCPLCRSNITNIKLYNVEIVNSE